MKNVVKLLSMTLLISGVMFSSCRKDAEEMKSEQTRNLKSGNYQQPTQDITILTTIIIGTVEYPVTGQAVVGSYDGRIYECTATWTMFAGTNDEVDVAFTATLKSEYHDIMIPIDPSVMSNYTITVTNGLTETSTVIVALWTSIVAFCETNVTLMSYPFVLPADMAPYQYAIYEDGLSGLFDYMQTIFESYPVGAERGYFVISLNATNTFINYGFITSTSPYYDSEIFIEDPNEPFINIDTIDIDDEMIMMGCKKIENEDKNKVVQWAAKKLATNKYTVAVWQEGKLWKAEACKK